jgi:hypothetical protein
LLAAGVSEAEAESGAKRKAVRVKPDRLLFSES